MTRETAFITALRAMATDPAARSLLDDAAVLVTDGGDIVLTLDMLAEGVHFLPGTDPADIAWKLVAVNLSDLAAKGAEPLGVMLGYMLDRETDAAFAAGLEKALSHFDVALLGGDTIAVPDATSRVYAMTAMGLAAPHCAPARSGAQHGDAVYVTGTIGDAGAGLSLCRDGKDHPAHLVSAYMRPRPRLAEGQALAPYVSAMMDISDGLLIDAARIAEASGCAIRVALDAVPLSAELVALAGEDRETRLKAATAGDDYELLFTAQADVACPVEATQIGLCELGAGLVLTWHGEEIALPDRLGFQH